MPAERVNKFNELWLKAKALQVEMDVNRAEIIKLKEENEKHLINNDETLQRFLSNYPVFFGAYNSLP